MKPTFEHTVNVLVQAYLNGTLAHRECAACAVGNIMRGSGYVFANDSTAHDTQWLRKINKYIRRLHVDWYIDERIADEQIEITGYSMHELSRIEDAFENADSGETREDWMFNGLMAVVDVLAEIHGVDLSVRESAKLQFVKP